MFAFLGVRPQHTVLASAASAAVPTAVIMDRDLYMMYVRALEVLHLGLGELRDC